MPGKSRICRGDALLGLVLDNPRSQGCFNAPRSARLARGQGRGSSSGAARPVSATFVPRALSAPPPEDWPDACSLCLYGSPAMTKARAEEIVSAMCGLLHVVVCRGGHGWHAAIREDYGK